MADVSAKKLAEILQSIQIAGALQGGSNSGKTSDVWLAPSANASIPLYSGQNDNLTLNPNINSSYYGGKFAKPTPGVGINYKATW